MKKTTLTKGYSLIEVLVAVAILMFSIVGPITIAVKSMQSAQYALQQNTAFFLAQEGITAVNTLRNEGALRHILNGQPEWSWADESGWLSSCFAATGCGIDFRDESVLNNIVACSANANACTLRFNDAGTRAKFTYTAAGVLSPYRRVITLTTLNGGNEVSVVSTVEWTSRLFGEAQMVTLTSSVFNIYK